MKIGVPREVHAGEKRVATTPEAAVQLQKLGFSVAVESGAGEAAKFSDDAYREAGVEIISDARKLWSSCDIILKVRAPERHPDLGVDEVELLRAGQTLISFIWPAQNEDLMQRLADSRAAVAVTDCPTCRMQMEQLGTLPVRHPVEIVCDLALRAVNC